MIRVYKTFFGQWRWQIKAANHKIVAASSESFKTRAGCLNNLMLTKSYLAEVNPLEL